MELLEVDCGNRVERGLPPLNIPPPPPNLRARVWSLSHPLSRGSAVGCSNERWLVADCDLCGGGFGCAGRGPVEGRRWIRGVTGGDNLITAFYLLSSSSSRLAGSLARLRPRHVAMVTWNLVRSQELGGKDLMVGTEMDTRWGCVNESHPRRRETRRRRDSRGFLICRVDRAYLNLTVGVVVRVTVRSLVYTIKNSPKDYQIT